MIGFGAHSCAFNALTEKESIQHAADLGYDCYELDIQPRVNSRVDFESYWKSFCAEWYKKRTPIPITSLCLGVLWYVNLAAGSFEERAFASEIVRLCMVAAEKMGAKALLLPVGTPFEYPVEDARAVLVETMVPLAKEAYERGIILGIENVCQRIILTAEELAGIIDAVDSPGCRAYYDVGNAALIGEKPERGIQLLGKRIFQYHIKDMQILRPYGNNPKGGYGKRVLSRGDSTIWDVGKTCVIGNGLVQWETVAKEIRATDFSGYLINETVAESIEERTAYEQLKKMKLVFNS